MLKKTITFEDLDGNKVTEDFYFNLSKSELIKMEAATEGGISKQLKDVVASDDKAKILALFEDIVLKTYGERGEDNKTFLKSPEISRRFSQTGAYDVLFMELLGNEKAAAEFIRALMPADLMAQVQAELAKSPTSTDAVPPSPTTVDTSEPAQISYQRYTPKELAEMSAEELQAEIERRKAQG